MKNHALSTTGTVLEKLRHPHKRLSTLPSKNCLTSYHLPAGAKPGPFFCPVVGWLAGSSRPKSGAAAVHVWSRTLRGEGS